MRTWIEIITESSGFEVPILYHGTDRESAENLIANGWTPNTWGQGGNMGQARYLYLTNGRENALWFAQEKGEDCVLEVTGVPLSFLNVDPEDGFGDTVEEELTSEHGLPGNVVLTKPLPASHFRIV